MTDFSRMSGYKKDCNFTQVKFGADAPLLEVELNELQQIQNEARADLVRQEIPSGFLSLATLDFEYMKTHPNTIKTSSDSVLNVNGYLVKIPQGTEIKLGDCPSVGRRNDLVMLECWMAEVGYNKAIDKYGKEGAQGVENYLQDPRVGIETSRRVQLKYRIRVVENANFSDSRGEGLTGVKAMGAGEVETPLEYKLSKVDKGLYVAGNSELNSLSNLRTVDGYSYAIPLYKVTRRNTASYEAKNGNGGSIYENEHSKPTRPDGLFSNIIYDRDIVDLRHLVRPMGLNYKKLLDENFDKFMRGELQTKERLSMDKIYLGVLKTPMDEFIQFYASLDGDVNAQVGGSAKVAKGFNYRFLPSPIGLGLVGTNWEGGKTDKDNILSWTLPFTMKDYLTVDFFVQKTYNAHTDDKVIDLINLVDTNSKRNMLNIKVQNDSLFIYCQNTKGLDVVKEEAISALTLNRKKPIHIRVIYDYIAKTLKYYINGTFIKQVERINLDLNAVTNYSVKLGNYGYILSDFNISSVARNNEFKTLPKDFIDGFDSIAPAFNGQRKVYSEAITFQRATGIAYAVGAGHSAGISTTIKSTGKWAKGDKINIKALADEIVTGTIDKDAVLARLVNKANNTSIIQVDAVNKLESGDSIKLYNTATGHISEEMEISDIDKKNRLITLDKSVDVGNDFMYYVVVETSTEASRPVIRYMNSKKKITKLEGSWSGVGTACATFTLGDNSDLTNQDIQVDYGLIISAGQGAINDILTNTLCGEIKGRKLKIGKIAVVDDFAGKVKGQLGENPNVAYVCSGAEPQEPLSVSWTEEEQSGYIAFMVAKDKNEKQVNSKASGERAQVKFVFNLLKMVEGKFGAIKAIDKVEWLRNNVDKIHLTWVGKATGADDNTAHFSARNVKTNKWVGDEFKSEELHPITLDISNQEEYIDDNGCITTIVYSEKASELVVASVVTDYIKCELEFNYPNDYDILVPENPRRDAGQCGIIMIRKSTKEIMTYFDSTKEDGLIVYGEFVPLYPIIDKDVEFTILEEGDGFLVSDLASSVGHKQGKHHYLNPLNRVRNDIVDLFGEFGFGVIPFAGDSKGVNIGAKVKFNSYGALDYFTRQYGIPVIDKPLVGIARYLVLHEGEIKMLIFSRYTNSGALSVDDCGVCMLVPIENRPLVHEIEGIKRTNVLPTAWRTPTGAVEGYLNEDGQLIATYQ